MAGDIKPVRASRVDKDSLPETRKEYAAGWLQISAEPGEDLIRLSGHVWSDVFIGVESRRVYKRVKKANEWFRFAFFDQSE